MHEILKVFRSIQRVHMVLNDGQASRAEPENPQLTLRLICFAYDVQHNCAVSSVQLHFQASHTNLVLLLI